VPAGKMLSGSPAFDNRTWLRAVAVFQRLPEMLRRLHQLEKAAIEKSPSPAGIRAESPGSQVYIGKEGQL